MADDDGYEVGYGRPPKHTRFQKGRSGNPSGKKRPQEGPGQIFHRLLRESVTVSENGRKRTMAKLEVVLSQIINKAASGSDKHFKLFLEMMTRFPPEAVTMRLDREDEQFLADFLAAAKALDDEY
ncbi:DUF5681 domain-containing protein [Sphingobium sp. B12D2B]|uniref:DUF5681 domain-containing protein n=1 Tax=Sphingobium sp. B12D2B TaxID=2940577 RepID=UPI00222517B0|nr:DUF5681 domain-containing protein [Sphingobium sp. B12D2B]MCW2349179.1 hypothetical protein [Sphingobium sp. B12D2B]